MADRPLWAHHMWAAWCLTWLMPCLNFPWMRLLNQGTPLPVDFNQVLELDGLGWFGLRQEHTTADHLPIFRVRQRYFVYLMQQYTDILTNRLQLIVTSRYPGQLLPIRPSVAAARLPMAPQFLVPDQQTMQNAFHTFAETVQMRPQPQGHPLWANPNAGVVPGAYLLGQQVRTAAPAPNFQQPAPRAQVTVANTNRGSDQGQAGGRHGDEPANARGNVADASTDTSGKSTMFRLINESH